MSSINSLSRLTSAVTSSAASDVVRHDELTTSGSLVDGGTPTTSHTGVLTIDFGAVT
jgi:hypothetical protein